MTDTELVFKLLRVAQPAGEAALRLLTMMRLTDELLRATAT
jgi:hypothetical protein